MYNLDTQAVLTALTFAGDKAEESKVEQFFKIVWTITSSVSVKAQKWSSDQNEMMVLTNIHLLGKMCDPVSNRDSKSWLKLMTGEVFLTKGCVMVKKFLGKVN